MYRDIIKRNTILSNIPKRVYFYVGVPYCGFVVRLIKNKRHTQRETQRLFYSSWRETRRESINREFDSSPKTENGRKEKKQWP